MLSSRSLALAALVCGLALTLGACSSTGNTGSAGSANSAISAGGANRPGAPRVQGLVLEMAGTTAFAKGRSAVRPALGRELAALAPRLNAQAGKRLLILGPGDGGAGAGQTLLAQERAHSVRDYLVAMGADVTRLRSEARPGSTQLVIRPLEPDPR